MKALIIDTAKEYGETTRCLKKDFEVDIVENSQTALQAFALSISMNNSYDLVLMSKSMPETDGISTIEAIRRMQAVTGVGKSRFIVTCSHGKPEDHIERLIDLDTVSFIHRPLSEGKMKNALASLGLPKAKPGN